MEKEQLQWNDSSQDEIDLVDIFRILYKHSKLIIGGTLLATAIAVAIVLVLPKIYEVSSIFEPGKVGDNNIVSPEYLKESILGSAYDYKIRESLQIPPEDYPKFKVYIPKNTSLVKVSIEGSDTKKSEDILNKLNSFLNEDINERIKYEQDLIKNQMSIAVINNKKIEEKIILLRNQIEQTRKKIKLLEASKLKALSISTEGAMSVLLYSNEIQNQQTYADAQEEKLKNLEEESQGADVRIDNLQLQLNRLKGMKIIKPVTVSDKPVKPKKTLIVVLVFVASLLAMSMCAFVLQWVASVKPTRQDR